MAHISKIPFHLLDVSCPGQSIMHRRRLAELMMTPQTSEPRAEGRTRDEKEASEGLMGSNGEKVRQGGGEEFSGAL